jgi:hypothetical protein
MDSAVTTLWVNPAAETDAGVAAGDTQTAARIASFGFLQDPDLGGTMLVDDLKAGLTFASVLPSTFVVRIPLTLRRAGGNVILSWSNPAFALQSAPTATGTYTNVPAASSPYTNSISGSARYFRLLGN